jgi:hypothetical protein
MGNRNMRSLELTLSRRRVLAGAAGLSFAAAAAGLWSRVRAAPRITITEGNMQPMPIALPDFVGGALPDPAMARGVTQIITSNLQRSGLFAPIDQAAYIEKITNIDQVRFPDWRQINAQALVTGTLSPARRPARRPLPALGCVRGPVSRRQGIFHTARQLAAHRASHLGRDL